MSRFLCASSPPTSGRGSSCLRGSNPPRSLTVARHKQPCSATTLYCFPSPCAEMVSATGAKHNSDQLLIAGKFTALDYLRLRPPVLVPPLGLRGNDVVANTLHGPQGGGEEALVAAGTLHDDCCARVPWQWLIRSTAPRTTPGGCAGVGDGDGGAAVHAAYSVGVRENCGTAEGAFYVLLYVSRAWLHTKSADLSLARVGELQEALNAETVPATGDHPLVEVFATFKLVQANNTLKVGGRMTCLPFVQLLGVLPVPLFSLGLVRQNLCLELPGQILIICHRSSSRHRSSCQQIRTRLLCPQLPPIGSIKYRNCSF
eukprot:Hpha_TRINITY_DN10267_c1_g1::TRINITY_DN10267_c1_g1_i1::g.35177::m.35177